MIDSAGSVLTTEVVSNDVLTARCKFEGDAVPSEVKWFKGAEEVVFDGTSKIENTNTKQLDNSWQYYSDITIKNFDLTMEDTYSCKFIFADTNNVEGSLIATYAKVRLFL